MTADWVIPHRARLEEVRLGLIEDQLAARLELGAAGEVIGELEALVHVHPQREGLWALLMVALYRDGRQADALATYQRARSWLADELGLDPGLQLQQLEQQILAHDATLGAAAARRREGSGPRQPAGNLPALSAELVGRDTEVAAIADLLAERPARRDRRAGRRRQDRSGDRSGPSCSAHPPASHPAACGWPDSRPPRPPTTWSTRWSPRSNVGGEAALLERLKSSASMVILDNCEHVIDAAAALAVRLLDAAPGLRILCTSQVAARHRR